jgi:hypothetical protein
MDRHDASGLTFEDYLQGDGRIYASLTRGPSVSAHWAEEAFGSHAMLISNALSAALPLVLDLSGRVKARQAGYYLRFGLARRVLMISHAYRDLIGTASVERKKPLAGDEVRNVEQDLNTIYVNLRGAMDNLCLALLHEHGTKPLKVKPAKQGLFLPCIKEDQRFASLLPLLGPHDLWERDFSKRRDPSAHRIPLTVPPSFLRSAESTSYATLLGDYWTAVGYEDFESASGIMSDLETLGTFTPVFMHDPDHGAIPIYPVIPDDIGHVLMLVKGVCRFLIGDAC